MTNTTDLRAAAQAVIDRWDTPTWKDVPATAEYIDRLRSALTAPAQAVAHDALRCMVGNCKFNGEVDKHATGCSAAAKTEDALLKALTEATRSLETIQLMAGKDDYLQDMAQVRAYATSRAMAANTAIAAFEDAPAQPVPASVITASVMRDDGGEQQAFCLMVAYRAEKDAMTALAMLTDEPAQAAAPTQAAPVDAESAGRTDAEIVEQTETLARYLLSWKWGLEPDSPKTKLRNSQNHKAQKAWNAACEIQDLLTATDVENAVAEVDDATRAAQKWKP